MAGHPKDTGLIFLLVFRGRWFGDRIAFAEKADRTFDDLGLSSIFSTSIFRRLILFLTEQRGGSGSCDGHEGGEAAKKPWPGRHCVGGSPDDAFWDGGGAISNRRSSRFARLPDGAALYHPQMERMTWWLPCCGKGWAQLSRDAESGFKGASVC